MHLVALGVGFFRPAKPARYYAAGFSEIGHPSEKGGTPRTARAMSANFHDAKTPGHRHRIPGPLRENRNDRSPKRFLRRVPFLLLASFHIRAGSSITGMEDHQAAFERCTPIKTFAQSPIFRGSFFVCHYDPNQHANSSPASSPLS